MASSYFWTLSFLPLPSHLSPRLRRTQSLASLRPPCSNLPLWKDECPQVKCPALGAVWTTEGTGDSGSGLCSLLLLLLSRSVASNSVRPHRWQPTRLPRPWDSPGKNTGVGCHFLLQCMKVKSEREVTQLCPTLRDHTDCSLPGSSVHGLFQARVLEWGAIALEQA